MTRALFQYLDQSAELYSDRAAIEESDGAVISYAELARLSNLLRDRLHHQGIGPGDRVGLCLRKSADAVAAMFGIMKAGGAYVPVDPSAPTNRSAYIFQNCGVKAIVVEDSLAGRLRDEFKANGFNPLLIVLSGTGAGAALQQALDRYGSQDSAPPSANAFAQASQLAYILYTSGSTGRPKGVMISHGNAMPFVDWCSDAFQPTEKDRFSSHAPFHFDLSILDIYVSLKHGATMVIVEEQLGKDPLRLAAWISDRRLTIWYSAPSILSMLAQFGKLDEQEFSSLRTILFAGEVFPIKYLRLLKSLLPHPRFFNLYGPTETNVCTWCEVPQEIPESQTDAMSIGRPCAHCRALVVDADGAAVAPGGEGELCIAGPSVLQGYWNLPEQTASAFLTRRDARWYRTGDVVVEQADQTYRFLGRRDRMVKKRGNRIELGEIEAALYRHPNIKEAGVITFAGDESDVRIRAYVSTRNLARLSIIELKKFCADNLPLYMVPDQFQWLESLPKTSTDKLDYQKLQELS